MSENRWRTERRKVMVMVEYPNGERRAEWIEQDVQVADFMSNGVKVGETIALPTLTLNLDADEVDDEK